MGEGDTEKQIEFFKRLIDGVENSNHAAEHAMAKAYECLHPTSDMATKREVGGTELKGWVSGHRNCYTCHKPKRLCRCDWRN